MISRYPRQCVWMTISVKRSCVKERSARCKEIIHYAREKNAKVGGIYNEVDQLVDLILGVCEKQVDMMTKSLSLKRDFKQLFNFFDNGRRFFLSKFQKHNYLLVFI